MSRSSTAYAACIRFSHRPVLGFLIDPHQLPSNLIAADYETLQPYLAAALTAEHTDEETHERAVAAQGMVKAADLLAGEYHLVITNVPYLGAKKQHDALSSHLEKHYEEGKADLATACVLRCLELCTGGGSTSLVTPQNWLFLGSYKKLRERLLNCRTWNCVARLGPGAFETISGHVVNVALLVLSSSRPNDAATTAGIDASIANEPAAKAGLLRGIPGGISIVGQALQLKNPDAKIAFEVTSAAAMLSDYATAPRGIVSGDRDFWVRMFWEQSALGGRWRLLQSAVSQTNHHGGRETVIDWSTNGKGMLRPGLGNTSYGKHGVAVSQVGHLPCTLYTGELYDNSTFAVVPRDPADVPAIWAFCSSAEYNIAVRKFNQKLSVDPSHLIQVPFNLSHWRQLANEKYVVGLPEPETDDPTQWLYHGHLKESTAPFRWPWRGWRVTDGRRSWTRVCV